MSEIGFCHGLSSKSLITGLHLFLGKAKEERKICQFVSGFFLVLRFACQFVLSIFFILIYN